MVTRESLTQPHAKRPGVLHQRWGVPGLLLLSILACESGQARPPLGFRLATTTSVDDSGLLDTLQAAFRQAHPNIRMTAVSGGTGEVLEIARRGDADITITHDPAGESSFVTSGLGKQRLEFMRNDFVIAGPVSDPAGVRGQRDASAALQQIGRRRATFVSRGDDSGTHRKERSLWPNPPRAQWYLEAGAGMGDALRLANARQAYILTDRGTFLRFRSQLSLEVLVEGDPRLLNRYSLMRMTNARNAEAADSFASWLLSESGSHIIRNFGVKEFGRPLFEPTR